MWPTVVVLVGTLAIVALVLAAVADRTPGAFTDPVASSGASPEASTPTGATPDGASPEAATPEVSRPGSPEPTASGPVDPSADVTPEPSAGPTQAAGDVAVDVLNQTLADGLAARAADVLSSAGWTIGRVDNAALGSPSTTVYIPPGLDDQAAILLDGFPVLTRTRPAFEGLATDALTLVVAEPDGASVVEQMERLATGDVPIASQSAP